VAGIGDKFTVELAFGDSNVLPIIIDPAYSPQRESTIVLDGWQEVPQVLREDV
jgi:hypothetical protein